MRLWTIVKRVEAQKERRVLFAPLDPFSLKMIILTSSSLEAISLGGERDIRTWFFVDWIEQSVTASGWICSLLVEASTSNLRDPTIDH